MKEYKVLANQTIVYGLGTIVPRLLNYLLTPFYTRIFLPEAYGVVIELYAYVAILMVLLTYGMETTFFRFTSNSSKANIIYNNSLASLITTSLLFFVFATLFKQNIANLIGYQQHSIYISLFVGIVVLDAITAIPFAKLRNENKALKFASIKIANVLINIGLNIFFLVICKNSDIPFLANIYNPNIGVGYVFISNLFASLFNLLALSKEFFAFRFQLDSKLFKKMLTYSWPLLIVGLAGMFNEVADKILLKYLSADNLNAMEQVGIYGANYKLAILMTIFIQMFKYAAEPFFFKQSGKSNAKESYAVVMNAFVIFCLAIFLLVTLFIDVFKYFIDDKFWSGLHIVPIVLLANMFLGVYYNLSVWYKINNKTLYGAVIALIGVGITLVLNLIFIPTIGYLGSAWAHFMCYFVMVLVSFLWGRKVYRVNYNLKKAFIYFISAIIIFFVHLGLSKEFHEYKFVMAIMGYMLFAVIFIKMEGITINKVKAFIKS